MMASSLSRIPLASSRVISRVLSSARSATSGTALSPALPHLLRFENLDDGIAAGRTVDGWQMPKGSKPGDLVIWYAAGRQQYIARGWVDAIPTLVRDGPGPYRGPVAGMERIEPPVDRRKVIRDCGLDGGVESYQTVDEGLVVDFLKSLGLSHLTPRLRLGQLCPTCHQVMQLTGVCDNCG